MKTPRPPCILLIEADDAIRSSLDRVLAGAGYDVISACDGLIVLNCCASERMDLIILDIDTLGESAERVLDCLGRRTPPVPVLIHSVQASRADRDLVRTIGGLMEKSVETEAVLQQVAALLERPPNYWTQASPPVRVIILQGLRIRAHHAPRSRLPYQPLYH